MKSVNSSIALVVLVAFGGLALPCVCSDDPYLELSKYLTERIPNESPDAETLQANVMAVQPLVRPRRPVRRRSGEPGCGGQHTLQSLATELANLYDGEDIDALCCVLRLESLILLMEAALDYHLQPNPSSEVERLNGLLIRLKAKVLGRCFGFLEHRWQFLQQRWNGGQALGDEFTSIHKKVQQNIGLFERLICRPKDTPESINLLDQKALQRILYASVLVAEDPLVLQGKTKHQFISYLNERLFNPCDTLVQDRVAQPFGNSYKYLLGIERLNLPGDMEYSESVREAHRQTDYPLPIYLICDWLIFFLPQNDRLKMFENFYNAINHE